jgi:hypothetical protein
LVGRAGSTHPAKPAFNVAQHEAAIYEKSGHRPAFGEAKFFYQDELEAFYRESIDASHAEDYE